MESPKTVSKVNLDGHDGGDLGLGRGWKPGAIPLVDSDDDYEICTASTTNGSRRTKRSNRKVKCHDHTVQKLPIQSLDISPNDNDLTEHCNGETNTRCIDLGEENYASVSKSKTVPPTEILDMNVTLNSQANDHVNGNSTGLSSSRKDAALTVGEIPIGTSLRQQKQFYDLKVQELFAHTYLDEIEETGASAKDQTDKSVEESLKKIDVKLLQKKLYKAQLEVDLLKQDLELCQLQLQSKYKAISILRKQAVISNSETQKSSRKASQTSNKYQEDLNRLQFELEYKQTSLINSQQLWSERFDRISQENSALMATLEERSLEMKKLNAEKMAVVRERDELLALLDIQERERYETLRPHTEEQPYGEFSSAELAILGACRCRKDDPDPCGCSLAAASLKREVAELKQQVIQRKLQHQESMTTIDAYRKAFDEQLNRNKCLVRQLAEMTAAIMTNNNKAAKFKAAMKWLLQQLNEDLPVRNGNTEEMLTEQMVEEKTQQELILMLVDMVSDKNEALAHQRLAARLMADRARELEEKLTAYTNA